MLGVGSASIMPYIGYKFTYFLLNNLRIIQIIAFIWLTFMFFLCKSHIREQIFMLKMKCWLNFILPTPVMAKLIQAWLTLKLTIVFQLVNVRT